MDLLNILLEAAPADGAPSTISQFLPLILIIVVFYFFIIRPQSKRQKEERNFRDSLEKGAKVMTVGGVYGEVAEVTETYVMLRIDEGVKIKVSKACVTAVPDAEPEKK